MPEVYPPINYNVSVTEFPSAGTIGFLTTFVNEEGIVCSDWEVIDTGSPDSPIGLGKLLGLFVRADLP
jgi:hypothetical protein